MPYADTLNVYSKLGEGFEEKEAKIIALAIEKKCPRRSRRNPTERSSHKRRYG